MKSRFLLCLVILFFKLIFTASTDVPNESLINQQMKNETTSSTNTLPSFKNGREGELFPSVASSEDVTSPSSVEKLITSLSSDEKLVTSLSSEEKLASSPSSVDKLVTSPSTVKKLVTSPSTVKKQLQSDEFEMDDPVEVKEAEDIKTVKNSVVARKGVVDITSSVHARKGVEMEDMKSEEFIMRNVTESTTSNYVHTESPTNDFPKPLHTLPSTTTVATKSTDLNDQESTTTHLPKIISWTLPPLNISQHLKKPTLAVDAVKSNYSSTTPVIVGLIFGLVLIICIATLAYKKMQDVWSRRHYDRMDFLIDGMYDL